MSGIITTINSDELDIFKKEYVNLIDIQDEITKLEEQIPDKRKKKLYKEWLTRVNFFIDMYNAKSKYKVLNRYK
jgi:hypothetical protein